MQRKSYLKRVGQKPTQIISSNLKAHWMVYFFETYLRYKTVTRSLTQPVINKEDR